MVSGEFQVNPLIFLNMGAEMVYIIDQRLRAQKIAQEKEFLAVIVLNDLVQALFSDKYTPNLFNKSETYTIESTKSLFQQIAHCSIMKLNEQSMGKLYDLMLMSFKRQIILSSSPHEIYHVTVQHIDGVLNLIKDQQTQQFVLTCKNKVINQYRTLSPFDFLQVRGQLLRFTQQKKIRVQMFLSDQQQNNDGTFSIKNNRMAGVGVQKPGMECILRFTIQIGEIFCQNKKTIFQIKGHQQFEKNSFSNPFQGLQTDLGRNLYLNDEQQQMQMQHQSTPNDGKFNQKTIAKGDTLNMNSDHTKRELNDLAQLIKGKPTDEQMQHYQSIQLFSNKSQVSKPVDDKHLHEFIVFGRVLYFNYIYLDDCDNDNKSKKVKEQIQNQFKDLDSEQLEQDEDEEMDLLDMMDQAANK